MWFFLPSFSARKVVDKKCLLKKSFALFKKKFQVREEKASQLASEQIVLSGGTKGFTYAAALSSRQEGSKINLFCMLMKSLPL